MGVRDWQSGIGAGANDQGDDDIDGDMRDGKSGLHEHVPAVVAGADVIFRYDAERTNSSAMLERYGRDGQSIGTIVDDGVRQSGATAGLAGLDCALGALVCAGDDTDGDGLCAFLQSIY